ncbi:MAG TPA: polyphosphate kinase 1 [Myxococcaceae bacterium]|nr:polyphosphate kinase 1 [Myxococcaceae bacterium]
MIDARLEPHDPKLFINRELSWLSFNERVLEEARDPSLPLYERLKFAGICASNLDEFFMVRVAGLKQQQAGGVAETAADGLLPGEQLAAIAERVHNLVPELDRVLSAELLPELERAGVHLLRPEAFTADQRLAAHEYFHANVLPILTPLAVDPGHPFPHLRNKSLNVAVLLTRHARRRRKPPRESSLAVIQVPSVLDRLVRLPCMIGLSFALLEEIIAAYAGTLFPGYVVTRAAAFRVTRNWDLSIDEEESEDLLSTVQAELRRRDRGAAVRLEIAAGATAEIEHALATALRLAPHDVYRVGSPLQPNDLVALADLDTRAENRIEPWTPVIPAVLREADAILPVIARRDVLLHHPYDSFEPVVRFIEEAAEDPQVLAIKQTLYRTSGDSPITRALMRAAENGKQVAVLVEIKARFDEANNIAWARRLEESGVHVVYGLIGLKTHCKVALLVRREAIGLRRYVHLGTGNYNPQTAELYTDVSLLTARAEIADDVSALFNMLTGYAEAPQWKRLSVAPLGLLERILELIHRETQRALQGEPARIIAKMNALVEPTVIRALYAASQAGVSVDLLVRGICCLRPGLPGLSENIRVHSVVDRFLEHARVFAFGAGDRAEVYLSSADWMPRNFQRRVEVLFPMEDPALRARLLDEVLGLALKDTVKSRRLQRDGRYLPLLVNAEAQLRSQAAQMEIARGSIDAPLHEQVIRLVPAVPSAAVVQRERGHV